MMNQDIHKIFEDARKDPSLFRTLNIEELLNSSETGGYLENKSLKDISKDIYDIVQTLNVVYKEKKEICKKLANYRFVDEIYKLNRGNFLGKK